MNRDGVPLNQSNPPISGYGGNRDFFRLMNMIMYRDVMIIQPDLPNNQTESNGPASEDFINNLDEFTIDEEFKKKELQCSICLEDFKIGDKCIMLPCSDNSENDSENHVFHSNCETCSGIGKWLERNNSCPMCRKVFPKRENPENHVNPDNEEQINHIIPDPNTLENTLTDMITNYINEIEEENEQRDIQSAIELSLSDQ
jgi:hypothetical protein